MNDQDFDLVTIAQGIFAFMLGMDAFPDDTPLTAWRANRFTGCVQLSGGWQGAVILDASRSFAAAAAGRMFDLQPDAASEDRLREAVAELTAMIAENIQSDVPGPSYLSLASVASGQDFAFQVIDAIMRGDAAFLCGGEPVRIVICEKNPSSSWKCPDDRHNLCFERGDRLGRAPSLVGRIDRLGTDLQLAGSG